MLRQEINLYKNYEVKTQPGGKSPLSWKRYWLANLSFTGLMIVMVIAGFFENSYLQFSVYRSHKELTALQQQFVQIKSTFPQLFFNENINEAVDNLKKEMAAQKTIVEILSQHTPFSTDLLALSRTIVPKVWLSEIAIQRDGNEMVIKGDSYGMPNLNTFIKNLEADPLFAKYNVSMHEVKNNDVNDPNMRLKFEISLVRKPDAKLS